MHQLNTFLFVRCFLLLGSTSLISSEITINEIAWMGTTNSPYDEWIELHNSSSNAVDISGWLLKTQDNSVTITLNGTIPANGYFLLERTDDSSVAEINASQIYSGNLGNSNESLLLYNSNQQLIDQVSTWFAGNNTVKATMERSDPNAPSNEPSNWSASTSSYTNGFGTPKAINSTFNAGGTDSQCNYPTQLEITAINIGQGDSTLIATPNAIMLADAGESYWNSHNDAQKIADTIHEKYGQNCQTIDYVLISHFHLDHIGYLKAQENENGELITATGDLWTPGKDLYQPKFYAGLAYLAHELNFNIGQTIVRDFLNNNPNPSPKNGGSKTFRNWTAYFQSPKGIERLNPTTALLGDSQINLGFIHQQKVFIDIVQLDGLTPSNPIDGCDPSTYFGGAEFPLRGLRLNDPVPPSENDLSIAFVLNFGKFQMFIGGDTSGENYQSQWGYRYHDTETCLANDPILQSRYEGHLEVLRVNHHGSSHSSNTSFIDMFSPKVSIVSVGDNNTFGHVNPTVKDRIIQKSMVENLGMVLLTEAGAGITNENELCHTFYPTQCARVADNEFPLTTETNEVGDDNVSVTVYQKGHRYTVQGNRHKLLIEFLSY